MFCISSLCTRAWDMS
uniref:Uncharacterized protein n=1 Tax=Arundo donax TaxID=35708 RepID=A0A0A9FMG9_ARUDO